MGDIIVLILICAAAVLLAYWEYKRIQKYREKVAANPELPTISKLILTSPSRAIDQLRTKDTLEGLMVFFLSATIWAPLFIFAMAMTAKWVGNDSMGLEAFILMLIAPFELVIIVMITYTLYIREWRKLQTRDQKIYFVVRSFIYLLVLGLLLYFMMLLGSK